MTTMTARDRSVSEACNYRGVVPSAACTGARHGDNEAAYIAGCRCPQAREAHRIQRGRRHLRLIRQGPALQPPTGTVRRLRALAAIGYSVEDIAAGTGIRPSYIGQLQHTDRRVHRTTVEKVCAFYQRHADLRGPSPRAIHYAARNGWRSPMWWDDDTIDDPTFVVDSSPAEIDSHINSPIVDPIAVERRLKGDLTVRLTRAERLTAVSELHARGETRSRIERTLHMSGVEVTKALGRLSTQAREVDADRREAVEETDYNHAVSTEVAS